MARLPVFPRSSSYYYCSPPLPLSFTLYLLSLRFLPYNSLSHTKKYCIYRTGGFPNKHSALQHCLYNTNAIFFSPSTELFSFSEASSDLLFPLIFSSCLRDLAVAPLLQPSYSSSSSELT